MWQDSIIEYHYNDKHFYNKQTLFLSSIRAFSLETHIISVNITETDLHSQLHLILQ